METKAGIKINEAEIAAFLEKIPSSKNYGGHKFTDREDRIILEVWKQRKNKELAAKALGISYATMRTRYYQLVGREGGK